MDGTDGVQTVKASGGTVIAQNEATSEHFGMPGSAMKTGAVDFVLPLEEIAPALVQIADNRSRSLSTADVWSPPVVES